MTPAEAIGQRIKDARTHLGIRAIDLGTELGVTRNTVHDWEAGRYAPSLDRWPALAAALSTPWDVLFAPWDED